MVIPVQPPNFVTGVQKQSQEIQNENSGRFTGLLDYIKKKSSVLY